MAPLEAHRSAQDAFKLSVRDLNKAFLDVREAFKTSKMAIGTASRPLLDRLSRNTALGISQLKANRKLEARMVLLTFIKCMERINRMTFLDGIE